MKLLTCLLLWQMSGPTPCPGWWDVFSTIIHRSTWLRLNFSCPLLIIKCIYEHKAWFIYLQINLIVWRSLPNLMDEVHNSILGNLFFTYFSSFEAGNEWKNNSSEQWLKYVSLRCRSPQTQNICITFVQCWTNVEDVGPALCKFYTNVLCLLGMHRNVVLTSTNRLPSWNRPNSISVGWNTCIIATWWLPEAPGGRQPSTLHSIQSSRYLHTSTESKNLNKTKYVIATLPRQTRDVDPRLAQGRPPLSQPWVNVFCLLDMSNIIVRWGKPR